MKTKYESKRFDDGDTAPIATLGPDGRRIVLVSLWLYAVGVALVTARVEDPNYIGLMGALSCIVVSVPMMRSGYELVSPWSMVVLSVYVGNGLRGFFILAEIDGSRTIDELFILGRESSFFLLPGTIYLIALAAMTAGYMLPRPSRSDSQDTKGRSVYVFGGHLHVVVALCAIAGFVGFVLYVQQTGGLNIANISAKRMVIDGLGAESYGGSLGALRALSSVGGFAFWLMVADFSHRGVNHSLLSPRGIVLVVLFLNAAALPFYSSTRAEVVYLLVIAFAIQLCLGGKAPRPFQVVKVVAALLVILGVLTFLRNNSQPGEVTESTSAVAIGSVEDSLIYNRNFGDLATTSHVIAAVPEILPFNYGSTVVAWLMAPVPRAVWPDKPLISAGPTIGIKVFGTARTGVPPSLIGESYWGFGLGGAVALPFLFGALLRLVFERYRNVLHVSPGATILYCAVFLEFARTSFAGGVGAGAFNAVVTLITALVVLTLARGRELDQHKTLKGTPGLASGESPPKRGSLS